MPRLVTAVIATALPTDGVPAEIVLIPEGEHELTPDVDGKPKKITVKLPPERGAAIRGDLKLVEEGKGPWQLFKLSKDKTETRDLALPTIPN